jgi:hypothetical protein
MRHVLCALSCAALLLLAACSTETKAETPGFVNANCPMMGEPIDPEAPSTEWHGKKVGYCCDNCQAKFEALSDAEQTEKLKAAGADV